MKKGICSLFLLFVFFGCGMCPSGKTVSMNEQSRSDSELIRDILMKGDTSAYDDLSIAFLDYANEDQFLVYALIMANKYDYPQAYYHVYIHLWYLYGDDHQMLDSTTRKMALNYLRKAAEKGHEQAQEALRELDVN